MQRDRATVYRRWPTKVELVLDAVAQLSQADAGVADADHLPDTGTLRGDLVAMIQPFDAEQQRIRIQAMTGLLALARSDERLAEAATGAGLGPWIALNRALLARAVDRGEFAPPADLDLLAELIPTICVARAVQHLPITREFSIALIDGVLIPALRGAQ